LLLRPVGADDKDVRGVGAVVLQPRLTATSAHLGLDGNGASLTLRVIGACGATRIKKVCPEGWFRADLVLTADRPHPGPLPMGEGVTLRAPRFRVGLVTKTTARRGGQSHFDYKIGTALTPAFRPSKRRLPPSADCRPGSRAQLLPRGRGRCAQIMPHSSPPTLSQAAFLRRANAA
jgi:hypothetical protein